ncbi:hypothetical protein L9F63_008147 [Diploptera punctata]|uniref:FLYWCH-type domain-containing protein n=1 Tax=Diploptera punctata TaxID=6984 RepID=A0AAD7Z6B7_DIPPU|nr:hypothetical protein L9F63_008147 [Diploptera punctata]
MERMLLVIEGFKFRFHKTLANGLQQWTCSIKTCKCFLKLDSSNSVIEKMKNHSHEKVGEKMLQRQKISNAVKRKAMEDVCTRPTKLIHKELSAGNRESIDKFDIELIRRNIQYARTSSGYPVWPPLESHLFKLLLQLQYFVANNYTFSLHCWIQSSLLGHYMQSL